MRIEAHPGVEVIKGPADILVTESDINRYKRLKGPQTVLNQNYGEGKWGDKEVKAYIQESKFAKYQQKEKRPESKAVDERLDAYPEAFEAVTPNDLEMLRAMCYIEVNLERLNRQLAEPENHTTLKNLATAQTKLLTEHRQLQQILGIDKAGREKGKKARSALEEIQELVAEGARFIEEQLAKISYCGIEIGWLLHHFPEMGYEFETRCPRCGEEVQICTSASEPGSHNSERD